MVATKQVIGGQVDPEGLDGHFNDAVVLDPNEADLGYGDGSHRSKGLSIVVNLRILARPAQPSEVDLG